MPHGHAFAVSLWKGKMEDADACLAGKLRTLEACAPSPYPSSRSRQVPEQSHPQSRCKLVFSFRDNPSFRNREIVKDYHFGDAGPTWLPGWCGAWKIMDAVIYFQSYLKLGDTTFIEASSNILNTRYLNINCS